MAMHTQTECDTLAASVQTMVGEGLVDMKFFVRNTDEASTETVCAEVNALFEAIDDPKRRRPLVFGDSKRG